VVRLTTPRTRKNADHGCDAVRVDRFHVNIPLGASRDPGVDQHSRRCNPSRARGPECAFSGLQVSPISSSGIDRSAPAAFVPCGSAASFLQVISELKPRNNVPLCARIGKKNHVKRVLVGLVLVCGAPAAALAQEPKTGGVINA